MGCRADRRRAGRATHVAADSHRAGPHRLQRHATRRREVAGRGTRAEDGGPRGSERRGGASPRGDRESRVGRAPRRCPPAAGRSRTGPARTRLVAGTALEPRRVARAIKATAGDRGPRTRLRRQATRRLSPRHLLGLFQVPHGRRNQRQFEGAGRGSGQHADGARTTRGSRCGVGRFSGGQRTGGLRFQTETRQGCRRIRRRLAPAGRGERTAHMVDGPIRTDRFGIDRGR